MKITELDNKIINLESFLENISDILENHIKGRKFNLLIPNTKNKNFLIKYSTLSLNIMISCKEIYSMMGSVNKTIINPKLKIKDSCLYRRILFSWKMRLLGMSVIIPIYDKRNIICLIMCKGGNIADWSRGDMKFISYIQKELSHCLKSIIIYNLSLERIKKNHSYLSCQSSKHQTKSIVKHIFVLISKKVGLL